MQADSAERIAAIDAVRGVAVLGILLPNIVAFAMPGYAYVDPTFFGGAQGANWWAWAITFVVADGKMRGLFTLLFGASTVLIAERTMAAGARPAPVHYARMIGLFVIGMVHAYLIWSGDILVLYAFCGALAFVAWRWDVSRLLGLAAALMAAQLALGAADHAAARSFEARAIAADAAPAIRAAWQAYRGTLEELRATIPHEIAAFRGGWQTALPMRASLTWNAQRHVLPGTVPETLALMLAGMALYRSGFFTGAWPAARYRALAVTGFCLGLPISALVAWWISSSGFDPITLLLAEPVHLVVARPLLMIGYAAATIMLAQHLELPRLTAVGRMAFSNYLATSIVCTFTFCGYGLGWFGALQRWQLYPLVAAVWATMLFWSLPWLTRFGQGPAERLWRSSSIILAGLMRHTNTTK